MFFKRWFISILFLMVTSAFQGRPPVKVIFLGDSLTQAGASKGGYIQLLKTKLDQLGKHHYELIGKGVGGNMIRHLLERFEKDVINQHPDVVFISVGINDVGFFTWHPETGGTPIDQYALGLRYMIKRMQQKNIRVILCTLTVIEEKYDGTNPLDNELNKYSDVVRELAREMDVELCDLRKEFMEYLKENNPSNNLKGTLTTDYVHMNAKGNQLIADTMFPVLLRKEP